jgi:hypothetical protein
VGSPQRILFHLGGTAEPDNSLLYHKIFVNFITCIVTGFFWRNHKILHMIYSTAIMNHIILSTFMLGYYALRCYCVLRCVTLLTCVTLLLCVTLRHFVTVRYVVLRFYCVLLCATLLLFVTV